MTLLLLLSILVGSQSGGDNRPLSITVTVKHAITLKPMQDVKVGFATRTMENPNPDPVSDSSYTKTITGANGTVTFTVARSKALLFLKATLPEYKQRDFDFNKVPSVGSAEDPTHFEILMDPLCTVTGRVVDSKDGHPLKNVLVQPIRVSEYKRPASIYPADPATSDSTGNFTVPHLTPGVYIFTLVPPNATTFGTHLPSEDQINVTKVFFDYPRESFPSSDLITLTGNMDVGSIPLQKQVLPSVYGILDPLPANPETYYIVELEPTPTNPTVEQIHYQIGVKGTEGFRLDNVAPGA